MFCILILFLQLSAAHSREDDPGLRQKRAVLGQNPMQDLNMGNPALIPGKQPLVQVNPVQPAGNRVQPAGIPVQPGVKLQETLLRNAPLMDNRPDMNQFKLNPQLDARGNPIAFNQRNIGVGGQQQNVYRKGSAIRLSDAPECAEDLARHCNMAMGSRRHNFAVLECLQRDAETQITEACQHLIYMYKRNLTKDGRFESAGKEVCGNALKKFPECKNERQENRIPCLIEYMDNITEPNCQQFLTKMAGIIFSDYRYVYHFMESCQGDIEKYSCGRLDHEVDKQHEQGKTLICLASKIGVLNPTCKKQVLRVAELQSDDFHLDRQLYYACREAREQFCDKVHSGGGKVFECLFKHKSEATMPAQCKEMLTIRQQLIAEDVKVEKTFYSACKKDMRRNGCVGGKSDDMSDSRRAAVLLCLENAMKMDKLLDPSCLEEMTELRQSLMEDYKITPDIVARCDHEIASFCHGGLKRGGQTLHCLMRIANPRKQRKGEELSTECKGALDNLLTVADVGSNFKVDKVLKDACGEVLDKECKNSPPKAKINCLMEKVDSDSMTDDCEDRLLEIQYFIVRDFRLDPILYKECHADAKNECHATDNWIETEKADVPYDPMVFPCLYRLVKHNPGSVSKGCTQEIKRVMRRRAKRVSLEPAIEDSCLADLGAFCSDLETYKKGEEIACLQDHMENLSESCEDAVKEFTEDEDEDLDLDTKLMRACTPMIKKFCGELLEHDAEASDVMSCLIENKLHHEMDKKCAAGVEHHQIIQLKDIRFSHKFRESCKKDIQDHCGDSQTKTKADIIRCLSETVRADILSEKGEAKHRISDECRGQLRVEVLRRGETIQLDPDLKEKCQTDISSYCGSVTSGNAQVIQCLKDNKAKLSNNCHLLIFKRQQEEAALGADYLLFRVCKPMIKTYCKSVDDATDVIDCLKRNRNMDSFETKCRALLMKKILQETKDYRLNPSLAKHCRQDIPKFCSHVRSQHEKEGKSEQEFEGAIVNCLKLQFVKKLLSRDCGTEIKTLVMESHLDIDMDPVLMRKCHSEIRNLCGPYLEDHEKTQNARLKFQPDSTGDKVEECLQTKLHEKKIPLTSECGREISRLIEESHIDVNVDPQLHTACQKDLTRWCQDIDSGEGRKMSCLLGCLEDFPQKLTVYCKTLLTKRLTLWEYAAKPAPAETMGDLADNVMQSPAKSYLMAVLMTIVGIIFIVGITCGRVTKRVTAETKNK